MSTHKHLINSFYTTLLLTLVLAVNPQTVAAGNIIKQGESVFNGIAGIGCKGCHGDYAEGDLGVGPYIRGASEGSIRAAISGIGPMTVVKDSITEDEIKAVSAYIGYLGQARVARTQVKRGRFVPDSFSTQPGTALQLVIKNGSFKAEHTFSISGDFSLSVPARKTGSVLWQAPAAEGAYKVACDDCKAKDQVFTINVTKDAPKFHATSPASKRSGTSGASDTM